MIVGNREGDDCGEEIVCEEEEQGVRYFPRKACRSILCQEEADVRPNEVVEVVVNLEQSVGVAKSIIEHGELGLCSSICLYMLVLIRVRVSQRT